MRIFFHIRYGVRELLEKFAWYIYIYGLMKS